MSKRTVFTTISPLPPGVSREVVLAFLHNHLEMIDLNPLVKERHPIDCPPQHLHEDERDCIWYSLTDRIDYLPGGKVSGDVSYTCAFYDLKNGLSTHCRAGLGVDIRDKWTVCGSLPGEPPEPVELGIGAPSSGLYLREDCDLRCNILMTSFVKKNLKRSHATLVQRLVEKSRIISSSGLVSEVAAATVAMPWSPPSYAHSGHGSASSTPPPPASSSSSPPPFPRPASYSGAPVAELGSMSPPELGINPMEDHYRHSHVPTFHQDDYHNNRERASTESSTAKYRPYSQYDIHSSQPPTFLIQDDEQNGRGRSSTESSKYKPYSQYDIHGQLPQTAPFPFALRVPSGPPYPAEQTPRFPLPHHHSMPPPSRASPEPPRVDPALYPTPLRIRGLSVGSNTTVGSNSSNSGYNLTATNTTITTTTTPKSPSTLTHNSSVRSVGSSYSRAFHVPSKIIAPPEQHPEYPVMNPYTARSSAASSGGSSPADEVQPNTPQFPAELVGSGGSDGRKYDYRGGASEMDHPAILRPGYGSGMSARLSGPFLSQYAELE